MMQFFKKENTSRDLIALIVLFLINFSFVLYVQTISNIEFDNNFFSIIFTRSYLTRLICDIACICLILTLPKLLQRVLFSLHIALCLAIYVYIQTLGYIPSLTAIISSLNHAQGVPLSTYVSLEVLAVLVVTLALIQVLITFSRPLVPEKRTKYILALCVVILSMQFASFIVRPFGFQTINTPDLSGYLRNSINARGFLVTFLCEWQAELYNKAEGVFSKERARLSKDIDVLPRVPVGNNIVMIQVECLGYELLNTEVNNKQVMPFLHSLQKNSVVLKLDGVKLLGSANSDYEILTTRKSSQQFMAYDFVTDFSGNIVEKLVEKGYATRMFHNVYGPFMNLETVYPLMGFQKMHFAEDMGKAGYTHITKWLSKIYSDADLFDYILTKAEKPQEKSLDFIITISMHEPHYTAHDTAPFSGNKYDAYFRACFDTDVAIKRYYDTLKDGTTVIIYGDHRSYFGEPTPFIPFIVHTKGLSTPYIDTETVYTRTDMSHYLRALFGVD